MARGRTRFSRSVSRSAARFVPIVVVLAAAGALAAAGSQLEDGRGSGGAGRAPKAAGRSSGGALTIAWGERPGSLDPAHAADATASNLVWNLMDPLVRLGENLEPVPHLARGWDVSADGKRITFTLREDGRWTNGDRVTARDFEYAWKRVLAPELRSPHASRLFGIRGAAAYHSCVGAGCAALADRVGVEAKDDRTLVVTLASPRPWFVAEAAHPAFLAVHRSTVERLGPDWTALRNIVTNGPFTLTGVDDRSVSLARNARWRNAARVRLARVAGRIVPDDLARVQAFDAGDVMTLDGSGLPVTAMPALRERQEYESYPALATYFYGFNLKTITDVHQRRAMSLALDRRALIENVIGTDELPATRFTPEATPDFRARDPASPWLPPDGDMAAAKAELDEAAVLKRAITLLHVDAPGNRAIATAVRDRWRELGIETTIRAQAPDHYLDFRGPLSEDSADVYQMDWAYGVPDAIGGLRLLTCRADRNKTNFCNAGFDALIERARREPEAVARESLYARAEEILAGERGLLPVMPLFWRTHPNLEALEIRRSFTIDPLGRIDLSAVAPE